MLGTTLVLRVVTNWLFHPTLVAMALLVDR